MKCLLGLICWHFTERCSSHRKTRWGETGTVLGWTSSTQQVACRLISPVLCLGGIIAALWKKKKKNNNSEMEDKQWRHRGKKRLLQSDYVVLLSCSQETVSETLRLLRLTLSLCNEGCCYQTSDTSLRLITKEKKKRKTDLTSSGLGGSAVNNTFRCAVWGHWWAEDGENTGIYY